MGNYIEGSSSGPYVGDHDIGNVNWGHNFNYYQEMIYDVASPIFGMACEPPTKVPNPDTSRFYNLLEAAKAPSW